MAFEAMSVNTKIDCLLDNQDYEIEYSVLISHLIIKTTFSADQTQIAVTEKISPSRISAAIPT